MENVHAGITQVLDTFIEQKRVPNLLFYGPSGSGKRTLLTKFVENIYSSSKDLINKYVLHVDCGHGRGIKFIRDEIKLYSKINVQDVDFKVIVLYNADKLTVDAQSALRRCIELFNYSTRFFIIVENKERLLRPICSRFSIIYVPLPMIKGKQMNLHILNAPVSDVLKQYNTKRYNYLDNQILSVKKNQTIPNMIQTINKLYERGVSAIDLVQHIKKCTRLDDIERAIILIAYEKVSKELRNEKTLMLFILNFYVRSVRPLENMYFM